MNRVPRVLILSWSAKNPFLEAWVATIRASGAAVAALVDARRSGETDVPAVLTTDTVLLTAAGPADWSARVEEQLGGPPDVVFDWWGTAALARRIVVDRWPATPRVLCVDTYPNASRLRAEVRDYAQANALLGRAHGLALASRAMGTAISRTTAGRFRSLPSAVIYSPFPLSAHYSGPAPAARTGPLRLCFTGRSDYLFSTESGMSKDAVGPYLEAFLARGAEVHVLRPDRPEVARLLEDRGFGFYPETPRDEIITGGLADVISRFDAHLVVYAGTTDTVRRRIANSLSTRFATAVCAPTPIVAPVSAHFVDELFESHPIGFRADDPSVILERVAEEGGDMRKAWFDSHEQWAGEAHRDALARLWSDVMAR